MSGAASDPDETRGCWDALAATSAVYYGGVGGGVSARGERWFAAVSGLDHCELNVCGLLPGADADDVHAVLRHLPGDLPGIVFVSEHAAPAARTLLVHHGFDLGVEVEPLMVLPRPPQPRPGPFTVDALDEAEVIAHAVPLMAEAHHVPAGLVERNVRAALASGAAQAWAARDGDEALSVVWIVRAGDALAVKEMMTPPRHQRRGAGSAVLTTALARSWDEGVRRAVLLSSVNGTRLYGSTGFAVADRSTTAFRGAEPGLLEALGQSAT
ncbi:MAG: GNAT family N-acetyltransferase [Actinobacteria bacterium]|nr:GNAT family N-acetyltransferase [Actinomycetota bacterium]